MARVPDILYIGQPAATNGALYTVGSGKKATITAIHAVNTATTTKYFSLHILQQGGSVADNICIAKTQKLVGTGDDAGGGLWTMEFPIPLNTVGDAISGIQETATAITVTIIGFEEAV